MHAKKTSTGTECFYSLILVSSVHVALWSNRSVGENITLSSYISLLWSQSILPSKHTLNSCYYLIMVIDFDPLRCKGLGLSDGEVMERLRSYLRRFSGMTKEMRPSHRIDVLAHALVYYWIRKKEKKMGVYCYACMVEPPVYTVDPRLSTPLASREIQEFNASNKVVWISEVIQTSLIQTVKFGQRCSGLLCLHGLV